MTTRTSAHLRVLTAVLVVAAVLAALAGGTAVANSRPPAGDESAVPRSPFPAFVLERGRYTDFEASDPAVSLVPGSINDRGKIAGEYLAPTRESGFLRDTRGRITRIDLPGAAGTQVDKINDRGQIVGNYSEQAASLPNATSRGFLLRRGKVTRIDVPGAMNTVPHGINDRGQVVGKYTDAGGTDRGFLWTRGRVRTFDVPGSSFTEPIAINDRGRIVGIYGDADGAIHGFLRRRGAYVTIDAPDVTVTLPSDINDRGEIVISGLTPTEADPLAGARGFVLREGVKGPFTPIGFPGAPRSLATGINDRGRIVGVYENPNATPAAQRSRMPLLDALPIPGIEGRETR